MIEVSHLVKRYGPTLALNDVSFKLAERQVSGFLGPNGAGKSTTMKILTGYLFADEGAASIAGHDVLEDPIGARRVIGYLPEHNPLYEEMGVVGFLDFMARARGVPTEARRDRIRHVVEACGLREMLPKAIGELSKGYRQRVGLAQAMVHDPQVLILDEPTSGLDPNQRREILDLIRRVGKEKTVIHSTHVLDEVRHTCDRILIIHRGKIVADGAPDEIALRGQDELSVRVALVAPEKAARVALEGIESVSGAEALSNGYIDPTAAAATKSKKGGDAKAARTGSKEHPAVFRLRLKKGTDCRRAVYDLAREKNWTLLELALEQASLDDIFKKLTRD